MKKLLLPFLLLVTLAGNAQYTKTNIITGIPYPVIMDIAPDGRYFIACKGGSGFSAPANAMVKVYNSTGSFQANLWDFTDSVEVYFERGVLGVELDPDFNTNHYVYVFYNHASPAMIRVVRFTETAGVGSNPTIIFEVADPNAAGNHTGGNIHFRPSDPDHLYISIGDRADNNDRAQMLNRWEGKILRIHKDGSIPTNNPFYDDGNPSTGNDDRIWSYGHRNPFDFTFNSITDSLYISENGQNTEDEMNLGVKGGNYGWPLCEGTQPYEGTCGGYLAPMEVWTAPLPAITGIIFYDSPVIAALQNNIVVVDYDNDNIWNIDLDATYNTVVSRTQVTGVGTFIGGLTDIVQGPEGCLYVIDGGYTATGRLSRICPVGLNVDEVQQVSPFSVFPNPANTILQINGGIVGDVVIIDINGKVVYTGTNSRVDVSTLQNGVYQVVVNKTHTHRFVKL